MFLHTLVIIAGFWLFLFICDLLLKTYRPWKASYLQWMERYGVTVSFAYIRYYTTGLNRAFYKSVNCSKPLSRVWFGAGTVVGVLLLFISVCLLVFTPFQALQTSDPSHRVLTPVMPGVNLPWSEGAYYAVALVLCGVFHEAGHAMAASLEQVRVNGFGVFLLFVYPGAFVDLHADHLSVISYKRQLRIYCAGVWHNVVLAVVVGLVLVTLPWLLCPLYSSGEGATVVSVLADGPLVGKLVPGELVTSLGGSCTVLGEHQWIDCIEKLAAEDQSGFCVPNQLLEGYPSYVINATELAPAECCHGDSLSDICFRVVGGGSHVHKCLTARAIASRQACYHPRDCHGMGEHSCLFPSTLATVQLVRIAHSGGQDVLFLGDPRELLYSASVSDYRPLYAAVPGWLPVFLQTLFRYIVSFSGALAVLNMLPAYALDGQWVLVALVELCLERWLPNPGHRKVLCTTILVGGTLLLFTNILIAVWTLIYW